MFPGLSLLPPGVVGVLGVEGLALETLPMAGLKLAKYSSQRRMQCIVFKTHTTVRSMTVIYRKIKVRTQTFSSKTKVTNDVKLTF
jgi:hypothetical protein